MRCKLEGLKAKNSDAQQARRRAEIRGEGKAKEYREKFHTREKKSGRARFATIFVCFSEQTL